MTNITTSTTKGVPAKTTAQNAPLKPLYLIISEQAFLRQQALDRLKDRLEEDYGDLTLDSDMFDASTADFDPQRVLAAANTLPFAAPRRLVIVQAADKLSTVALKELVPYAKNPNPTTILVFVAEKFSAVSVFYKAIKENGDVLNRKVPDRRELPGYVGAMFAAEKLVADPSAVTTLINLIGNDLSALGTAVKKLAAYTTASTQPARVTREDVARVVAETVEVKSWEFGSALEQKDAANALRTLARLVENDTSALNFACYMAVTKVRELLTARALIERGEGNPATLAAQLKSQSEAKARPLPDWLARKTLQNARRFSLAELRTALGELASTEQTIKTSQPLLGRLALERVVLRLCS